MNDNKLLEKLGAQIEEAINAEVSVPQGFILFVFPFEQPVTNVDYIATAAPPDILDILEDGVRHIQDKLNAKT